MDKIRSIAYNFVPVSNEETEIEIYDVIASKKSCDWNGKEGTEVTATDFKEKLKSITTPNITIRMNSAGGEVAVATVIAGAIQEARQAGKHIVCKIDGTCASAAVQIAISCDKTVIHPSALMMIHNPMLFMFGYYDAPELTKTENYLNTTKNAIINFYEEKTSLSREELSEMMDSETWMTGKEAVEKGFADEIMVFGEVEEEEVVNRIKNAYTVNESLKLPESYQVAINKLNPKQKGESGKMEIKTAQDLVEQFPDLTAQIKDECINAAKEDGIKEGMERERNRIKAIDELSDKISAELINKAKYETFETAENIAVEALKTGAFKQMAVVNAMARETEPANAVGAVANNGTASPVIDEKKEATKRAEQIAAKHLKSIGKEK